MKITESKLRRVIRQVIREERAHEDEKLLGIGGDFSGSYHDRYDREEVDYQVNDKVLQLFKAWCNKNKNNVVGMGSQEIVDFFFEDYPELSKTSDMTFRRKLLAHAGQCSQISI